MLTIRCIFVTLVVTILLDEVLGNCQYQAVHWKDFQKAYGINSYKSEYRFYIRFNTEASNGYTGRFRINGETHELPVAAIGVVLYTNNTIPFWFTTSSMTIRSYVDGSPLKVSTLHENGSITVKYLGNKFDPMCRNLDCQHEDIVPNNVVQKKELLDPNGWTSFQTVVVPFARGTEGPIKLQSDEQLTCSLDRA